MPLKTFVPGRESEVVVGCDEVGRGAGAGCVTAAAVVWANDFQPATPEEAKLLERIRDSKKLSPALRTRLATFIQENAVAYAVCDVSNQEIDAINILQATFKAMHGAIDNVCVDVDRILVDGDKFKAYLSPSTGDFVPHTCVIGGDDEYLCIAAASILAKHHRDTLMSELHTTYPQYNWEKNKGYLTNEHMNAIREHGPSPLHRKTFLRRV